MKYPVLHLGCTPNPSFTIVPVTDPTMKIDGNPVITRFTWKSNSDPSSTGTVPSGAGGSQYMTINGVNVLLIDSSVAPYYAPPAVTTVLSD